MAATINFCNFYKFGFCKFGGKCRKIHHIEICEQNFCENVKFCEKRHPRRCYYYCAYGFCKFGTDCKFLHKFQLSKPPAKKDSKQEEENEALKEELFELHVKHERLQDQLDNLMETQSKHDDLNKDAVTNEIDNFKNEFVHILNDKNVIINNQAIKMAKLSLEIGHLQQENSITKQTKCYACDICDFESEQKQNLLIHRQENHGHLIESESETEESDYDDSPCPTYHCDLCDYSAMYPDNVAFHYGDNHGIKMSWEEAEKNFKR